MSFLTNLGYVAYDPLIVGCQCNVTTSGTPLTQANGAVWALFRNPSQPAMTLNLTTGVFSFQSGGYLVSAVGSGVLGAFCEYYADVAFVPSLQSNAGVGTAGTGFRAAVSGSVYSMSTFVYALYSAVPFTFRFGEVVGTNGTAYTTFTIMRCSS